MEKPFSERFRVAFGAHAHRGATEVPHRRANRTGALGEFDVAQRFAVAVAAAVFGASAPKRHNHQAARYGREVAALDEIAALVGDERSHLFSARRVTNRLPFVPVLPLKRQSTNI